MKIELNFSKDLTTLKGESVPKFDIKGESLGNVPQSEALAELLGRQVKSADPMKIFYWGTDLFKTQKLSLDRSDVESLKKIIQSDEQTMDWVRGQLLVTIADGVSDSEKSTETKGPKKA